MSEFFHKCFKPKRYLMYLSYIGTEFCGIQSQTPRIPRENWVAVPTVQEKLENAIKSSLFPKEPPIVFISSRTDSGVHALKTAVHVSLIMNEETTPDFITANMNKYFSKENIGIRIQKTHLVPEWFSCRTHTTSRTYLYRLAFRKKGVPYSFSRIVAPIPFSEFERTFFIQDTEIDIGLMKETAALIHGTRNYISFMGRPSRNERQSSVRSIDLVEIIPSKAFMPEYDPYADHYDYWNVKCTGRSFFYRQVRRITGVLLAVGRGKMSVDDVKKLLDEPNENSWNNRAACPPGYGLYLVDVTFNPLEIDPSIFEEGQTEGCERRVTYALCYSCDETE